MTSELDELGDVLTVREVARVLRVNKDAAYAAIHRGQIPHVKIGRSLRVAKVELLRFLGVERSVKETMPDGVRSAPTLGGRDVPATARR